MQDLVNDTYHSTPISTQPVDAGRAQVCHSSAVEEGEEEWSAPSAPVMHNGVVDYYELLGVSFLVYGHASSGQNLSQKPLTDFRGPTF